MKSALYEGAVEHARKGPRPHAFRMRAHWFYLDLDELDDVFRGRWLWSARGPRVGWFRRADYMQPADRPLPDVVRDRVERELGFRPAGPVRILTQVRTLGYVFNPVSFYYCFDEEERLVAVAAEITNTPWRQRHTYVLDARGADGPRRFRFDKAFHVSPFHPMEQAYEWTFDAPGEELTVHMTNREADEPVFHVGMRLERRPITGPRLAWLLLRHPLQTFRIHAAIYVHAAILWWKRTPFHAHPERRAAARDTSALQ